MRDQFVERITYGDNDVLVKLARGEQHDRAGNDCAPIIFRERREGDDLTEGEKTQRQVPHVRVAKVHSVLHVAHHEITGGDENRHEEFRFHRAIESKDCSEREN